MKWKLPDECICCDAENSYKIAVLTRLYPFKSKEYWITFEAYKCSECGESILSPGQQDFVCKELYENNLEA